MDNEIDALNEALAKEREHNLELRSRSLEVKRQLEALNALFAEMTDDMAEHGERLRSSVDYTVTCCENALAEVRRAGIPSGSVELAHQSARDTSQAAWFVDAYLRSIHTLHRATQPSAG